MSEDQTAEKDAIREALPRIVCPVHGVPDCSPLLNGCSIPSHITRYREAVLDALLAAGVVRVIPPGSTAEMDVVPMCATYPPALSGAHPDYSVTPPGSTDKGQSAEPRA